MGDVVVEVDGVDPPREGEHFDELLRFPLRRGREAFGFAEFEDGGHVVGNDVAVEDAGAVIEDRFDHRFRVTAAETADADHGYASGALPEFGLHRFGTGGDAAARDADP